jgi:hypothetical protein
MVFVQATSEKLSWITNHALAQKNIFRKLHVSTINAFLKTASATRIAMLLLP